MRTPHSLHGRVSFVPLGRLQPCVYAESRSQYPQIAIVALQHMVAGMSAVVAELAATDPEVLWCERDGWARLQAAGCQLRGDAQPTPEDSALAVFDACAACGHSSLLTDYVHEICSDPEKSTAQVGSMALFDGNLLSRWLHTTCRATDAELRTICETGNGMSDESKLAQLRTRVLTCTHVNAALEHAGMQSKAVSPGACSDAVHGLSRALPANERT